MPANSCCPAVNAFTSPTPRKGAEPGSVLHIPADGQGELLSRLHSGHRITARVDWARRYRHMRFHTATHLLCALVPHAVDGCSITADYARLDFHMTDPLDKEEISRGIARLVAEARPVGHSWITDEELDANPQLVRSMSVQPPRGTGRVRVLRIDCVDLQPCGGTHVANTAEVGAVVATKIEKKSASTRRVVLGFAGRTVPGDPAAAFCHRNSRRASRLEAPMGPIAPLQALRLAPAAALAFALAAALPTLPARAASVVRTAEVRAELLAHAPQGVLPGQPIWLGLQLEHAPDWHTYWKNPGDSGAATTLDWRLPQGVSAGEIDWPAPHRLPIGPLVNYGYEGKVLLVAPLFLPVGYSARTVDIALRADWLVCKVECLPQSGDFQISLSTGATPLAVHRQAFDAASAARPAAITAAAQARVEDGDAAAGRDRTSRSRCAACRRRSSPKCRVSSSLPHRSHRIGPATPGPAACRFAMQRSASPRHLAVVLRFADRPAVRLDAPVAGEWPAGARRPAGSIATAGPSGAADAALDAGVESGRLGFGLALLAALAGGVLLNLMPCVFPVLSLKVLGFARHAGERRRLLAGALAYAAGVLLSFLVLGAVLLALRAAGEQLGWGFQLQSPAMVAGLALLFTMIGLNLAGVFELGSILPAGWLDLQARHPTVEAFMSGVLAVAVASPCTAPFMGAALGLALALPATEALAVFAALEWAWRCPMWC